MTTSLAELVSAHPLLAGLPGEAVASVAGCAQNVSFNPGDLLLAEGDPANTLYLLRRGRVAIEVHSPGRGPIVIETVGPGAVVGWSWLVPPYRWHFDARAVEAVGAVAVDGACLQGKGRDRSRTRLRAHEAGGRRAPRTPPDDPSSAARPLRDRQCSLISAGRNGAVLTTGATPVSGLMTPIPHRVVGRRDETDDVVTLLLSPTAGASPAFGLGQFNMLTAFGVGEAAISVSSAPA